MNITDLQYRKITYGLTISLLLWGLAVGFAAHSGLLAQLYMPLIAGLVALGVVIPTSIYLMSPILKAYVDRLGLFPITVLHIWRIPAACLFFWYGSQGALPPLFWILAGTGDLIAGLLATTVLYTKPSARWYAFIHTFGFIDFVVAVGTGLTYTLLLDPRMKIIAELPLALIPLFGVGISGTAHLVVYDYFRRHTLLPNASHPNLV